jgi:xylulokinase
VSRKEVTIGIDIGTTAVKAVAVDADGRVVARTRIAHELRVPMPDRLEHNADEAWRQGPLTVLKELGRPDALAIAVSAMVPSMTAVDADGRPMTPGLLYGDGRGRAPGPNNTATDGPFPVGEAAEFVRWTATRAPDAAGYWPAPAVANYALGREAVVDFPTAYTVSPLFDATGWNAEVCSQHGVTAGQMPRVDAPGEAAGQAGDAVLAVGAIDALCEQMVSGADDVGDVLVLCGTTLIVWVTIPEARQVPGLWTIPTMTGKSQIGGASKAGGLFLGWADRILGPGDPDTADPHRVPVWLPYLRGERTPFHDPDRRGMLDGLELGHDASALRRAAYEASGFVVRQLIELSGASVSRIVAAGGGTRVQPWMQAIADATGRPVQVSGVAEGAALGAAFLGRMAVGKESTITDAARWACIERAVEPHPAWVEPVGQRYRRFRELSSLT